MPLCANHPQSHAHANHAKKKKKKKTCRTKGLNLPSVPPHSYPGTWLAPHRLAHMCTPLRPTRPSRIVILSLLFLSSPQMMSMPRRYFCPTLCFFSTDTDNAAMLQTCNALCITISFFFGSSPPLLLSCPLRNGRTRCEHENAPHLTMAHISSYIVCSFSPFFSLSNVSPDPSRG